MTQDELKKNLGTIAKSGTSEFIKGVEKNASELGLIGQFGVGFYSVFLVCDRVTVASKSIESKDQFVWESTSEVRFFSLFFYNIGKAFTQNIALE
jgi:heat shock protein 90kDa beta